ncbi:MAG: hypothetical protein B6247_27685 [Candidatus Parabeggiatoa sp. nov. 2]|nr:MAG: hypothetical protein B6247_27685 [Beggiatoa sp. 4572_84]
MHTRRNCFSLLLNTFYTLCLLSLSIQPIYADSQCSLGQIKSGDPIALVIANSYNGTLKHPVNDAKAMREVLTKLGFRVIFKTELNGGSMNRATVDFSNCLQTSQGVGLFYFTGYGMQVDDKNYLLPINANVVDKHDMPYNTFPVEKMLKRLKELNNELNIIILDASRDNPYPSFGRRGLASMSPPSGFFIAYPTETGKTIQDDQRGKNSLYVEKLVEILETTVGNPKRIDDVFLQVGDVVLQESQGQQGPIRVTSLTTVFYLGRCANKLVVENWIADRKTGCRVWSIDRAPNEEISWSGQCVNCLAEGRGTLIKYRDSIKFNSFDGQIQNGRPQKGFIKWSYGDFKDHGFGGTFKDGKLYDGTYEWPNGNRFTGEFMDGKIHKGTYWSDGSRFDGEFLDGKGYNGTYIGKYGDRIEFRNGQPKRRLPVFGF